MKQTISTLCFCLTIALCGCSDSTPINVAEDADAAAIADYNRLNDLGMGSMEEAEAEVESADAP